MTFDLTSPAMKHDPYPGYAELRHQTSLVRISSPLVGKNVAFVTRYSDVSFILKDPRFINDGRKLPDWDDWTKKWYIPSVLKGFVNSMALKDEPDHTRLRVLVHKAFTPTMIQKLSSRIEQIANDLLDAVANKPVIDFMADFALPLPLTIIGEMMGVSSVDRMKFRRYMGNTITDISFSDPVNALLKIRNAFGLNNFLKTLIADRRRAPKDDLASALVQASEGGDRLSEDELVAMLFLILFAGHETTVNLIGSGTLALLQQPDQFAKLKANPALMDSTIEELLRYCNPVQHIAIRYALEDVVVGGVTIPKHDSILLGIAAANRDETIFENADQIDITRSPNRHIAFGFGVHYCLGAPLARLEAANAFTVLFNRFPNLQLAAPVESLKWRGAPSLRGLVQMPVRLSP